MTATLTRQSEALYRLRYLNGDETIDDLWTRVAGGNNEYKTLMEEGLFLPNSPALFNMGTGNGCTSSACFVFNVGDYMLYHDGKVMEDSIVRTREKAILVAKAGGGVGYYLGDLRPWKSPIKTIHRVACGPVGVLFDYHPIHDLVTQGGKRDLAQMGVLPVVHPDIRLFIHCKDKNPQALSSFNISVSWDDTSIDRAFNDHTPSGDHWRGLWDEQVTSAWGHGCPGMFFPDTVNRHNPNPHLGLMKAPNPCGETPNRSDEPCSLGSMCLWRFVNLKTREIDWGMLEDNVRLTFRFMDDILDRNIFPHPDITKAARLTRKLGLGVMGWADMLALLGIYYDTEQAVNLANDVMKFIRDICREESAKLAKEKGPYPGFSFNKTQDEMMRNETGTSVAPTGSIANLINASYSIEPHMPGKRVTNEGMNLTDGIPVWEYLDGFSPKMAHEIHWSWHVKHQAAFQRHTDLGVSKTINLPESATKQDVSDAYRMMYELDCKGGTIYRNNCRPEQVVIVEERKSVYTTELRQNLSGKEEEQQYHMMDNPAHIPTGPGGVSTDTPPPDVLGRLADSLRVKVKPRRRELAGEVPTIRRKFHIGDTKGYLHVGLYDDGTPGEIFLRVSLQGSTVEGMLNAWAISFSHGLQSGIPLAELIKAHEGTRFEPLGPTHVPEVPICTSIPDFVCRWLRWKFLDHSKSLKEVSTPSVNGAESYGKGSGQLCPECGGELRYHGGCLTCVKDGCNWTRCG